MYIDHRGELQAETSSSISGYEKAIFTDEVQDRFLKLANGEWQPNMQNIHSGKSRKKEKFKLCEVKEARKLTFFSPNRHGLVQLYHSFLVPPNPTTARRPHSLRVAVTPEQAVQTQSAAR